MEDSRERLENAPAAAPQGKPAGGFWRSLIDIFVDPGKVFSRIAAGLPWWKPYILIAVVTMAFGYLMLPFQRRLMEMSAQGLSEEQLQQMNKWGPVGLVMVPIIIIVASLIVAGIAHLFVSLMSSLSSYKKTLSLLMYCSLISLLGQIIGNIIVYSRGVEAVESREDLAVSLSLADLFSEGPAAVKALLQSIGVFQIWYYIVLVFGIAAIFKMSKAKAAVPVIAIWLLTFLMLFAGTKFGGGMR